MSPPVVPSEAIRYTLVRAAEGYLTVEPKPTQEMLNVFYRDRYFQQAVSATFQLAYSSEDLELMRRQDAMALALSERLLAGRALPKTLLDVACGEGFFLASARARGYDVAGMDYASYGIERHNPSMMTWFQAGDVLQLLDELAQAPRRFSLVNLSGILEHVLNPALLLTRAVQVLERGGLVRIVVPNDDSSIQRLAEQLGKAGKFWVCPPEHLSYFNTGTLRAFLSARGLVIKKLLAEFPIDYFLLNDWSNYVADPAKGKEAHRTRQHLQRLLHECDEEAYVGLLEAQARCGIGRDLIAYATAKEHEDPC